MTYSALPLSVSPTRALGLGLLLAAAACQGGGAGKSQEGADAGPPISPTGPRILSLNSNASLLHEGESLVVSAIVTDPDGIDDLIGGQLLHESGQAFGSFATAAAEGAYEIRLTLPEISAVHELSVAYQKGHDPNEALPTTFVARFFDTAGAQAEQTLIVSFGCSTAEEGLCDGVCTRLDGGGGGPCGGCDADACPSIKSVTRASCQDLCDSMQRSCEEFLVHEAYYNNSTPQYDVFHGCGYVPAAMYLNQFFIEQTCSCQ